jgi:hypothetical protein
MSAPKAILAATETGRGQAAVVPLLQLWRTAGPTPEHIIVERELRAMLRAIAVLREPGWPAAAAGDVIEAVGIALRASHKDVAAPLIVDLAGTALFLCAADGSAAAMAAAAALHHLRRRFASLASANNNRSEV